MKVPNLPELFWNLPGYFIEPSNLPLKILFFVWRTLVVLFIVLITVSSFWYEWTQMWGPPP